MHLVASVGSLHKISYYTLIKKKVLFLRDLLSDAQRVRFDFILVDKSSFISLLQINGGLASLIRLEGLSTSQSLPLLCKVGYFVCFLFWKYSQT